VFEEKETKSEALEPPQWLSISTNKRTEDTRHHNNTTAKSVPAKIIPATISGELCSTVAPALGLVVEVEDEPAPELVSDPVCPAAGEEVV
jgi:hypothetical protein